MHKRAESQTIALEALSVDNAWARLVIFSLGDPHGLKGGQRGQDRATDPDGVLSFWWSDDLDLHGAGRQGGDLFLHTIGNTWEHSGATRHDVIGIQVLSDVDVALHDGAENTLVDAWDFHAQE